MQNDLVFWYIVAILVLASLTREIVERLVGALLDMADAQRYSPLLPYVAVIVGAVMAWTFGVDLMRAVVIQFNPEPPPYTALRAFVGYVATGFVAGVNSGLVHEFIGLLSGAKDWVRAKSIQ